MFKWVGLGVGTAVGLFLCWAVNDVRLELRRSTEQVNRKLPAILESSQRATAQADELLHHKLPPVIENGQKVARTLAQLSDDVNQLRRLVGPTGSEAGRAVGLLAYANAVFDAVRASNGQIGLKAKTGKLKDARPAAEWLTGERAEIMLLVARARSKRELLDGVCTTAVFKSEWHIQIGETVEPLREYLAKRVPADD